MQDQKNDFEEFVFGNEKNETMEEIDMSDKNEKSKELSKDKIKCVKCNGIFAQRPDVREKRIEKFGSAKRLEENYLCRECRRNKVWNGKDWEAKPAKPAKKDKPKK